MSLAQLRSSRALHKRRRNFARKRMNRWQNRLDKALSDKIVNDGKVKKAREKLQLWRHRWGKEDRLVDRRTRQIAAHIDAKWGGSRAVTNEVIRIVGNRARVTSRKRWELFGNPSSDHYRGNKIADAVDFGIAEAHWLKNEIANRLTRGRVTSLIDYGTFTITRNGHDYRVQIIAGTHGTGPHLHVGVRRV